MSWPPKGGEWNCCLGVHPDPTSGRRCTYMRGGRERQAANMNGKYCVDWYSSGDRSSASSHQLVWSEDRATIEELSEEGGG